MSSTIGDHVELQRGTTYKSALLDKEGPLLLGLGSINRDGGFRSEKLRTYGGPSADKLLVYPGDLYVSLKDVTQSGDLLGSIARVPNNVTVGRMTQDTVKLIFKTDISRSYFYWLLRTPQYRQHCRSHATGTTNLGLSRDDFFSFEIPELTSDRNQIVNLLESLESKINLNNNTNQTLEQIAQAIFKSWFVDFDPVKAKMAVLEAGGTAEQAELAAMSAISAKDEATLKQLQAEQPEAYAELAQTAALFPSKMVDSELGEIPEGWDTGAIDDVVQFSTKRLQVSELSLENYISTENMLENKKGITTASSIPSGGTVPEFNEGDILVSNIRPYFKKIWLAKFKGGRSPDVLGFSCLDKNEIYYAYNLIYQDSFFEYMMTTSKGAKMPRGDKDAIKLFNFPLPLKELRIQYSKNVRAFYPWIKNSTEQIDELQTLRDTLLPKLLSGELIGE